MRIYMDPTELKARLLSLRTEIDNRASVIFGVWELTGTLDEEYRHELKNLFARLDSLASLWSKIQFH